MRRPRLVVHTLESRQHRRSTTPAGQLPAGVALSIHSRLSWGSRTGHTTSISENKTGRLVLSVGSTSARGQVMRARRAVALAAFETSFHVQFIDFDRVFNLWLRRQRSQEALDAPTGRLVPNVDSHV